MNSIKVKSSQYILYEDGRLFSEKKNRFLKGQISTIGYQLYFLDGKWEFAHRLVGEYFVEKPQDFTEDWEIDHLDENKLNNHYSNLEWVTHQVNIQRSYARGRKILTGADHWNFGKQASEESKKLMSLKKQGKKHPRFSGWFVVKGIKYGSAYEAERLTGIPKHNIFRWCKSGSKGEDFTFEHFN